MEKFIAALEKLERRNVITTMSSKAETCCGNMRDIDGFCIYRPGHPIYVDLEDDR